MIIYILIGLLLVLILTLLINTLKINRRLTKQEPYIPQEASKDAVERLSQGIQIPTISYSDYSRINIETHRKFQSFLGEAYPLFNKAAGKIILNDFSVIYKWPGKNPDLKPVLFMAHYDVVPVEEDRWTHPPFSGLIKDGEIWGRGTLDTKNTLLGIMEAAEELTAQGFSPERNLFFAFGGDEEVMGTKGAMTIARYFKEQDIQFEWLIDEGSITGDGLMAGMNKKLAMIGTAEKGYANILLKANSSGGHASRPPRHTATGLIAGAVASIENNPFPLKWLPTTRKMFKLLAGAASPTLRVALSNLGLTAPLIKSVMGKSPSAAALFRTTVAPTMIKGSNKENVLAEEASAILNVRILPGETIESVVKNLKRIIKNPAVSVTVYNEKEANNPVPESSSKTEGYSIIETSIQENIPDALVLPFLVTATTDSKQYSEVCENIYRYAPVILNEESVGMIHASNERISIENYGLCIRTFKSIMSKL